MATPYRRRTRVFGRSGPRLGNQRPGVLDGGADAPLSRRGRLEYRALILGLIGVGLLLVVIAAVATR